MTTGHQLALFCRYDMIVEFDYRLTQIEESLRQFGNRLEGMSEEQQIQHLFGEAELYPLRPRRDCQHVEIEKQGFLQGTGEQVYCYTAYVPFSGDEQLWHLNPGIVQDFPDGEVFRGELIIAILACNQEEGERRIAERLGRVDELIAQQNRRIDDFHKSLPDYIRTRLGRGAREFWRH